MKKLKRVLALGTAALLILLYLSTLIFSLLNTPAAQGLFKASIFCTVAVPAMIYAYMLIYRVLKGRGTPDYDKKNKPGKSSSDNTTSQS